MTLYICVWAGDTRSQRKKREQKKSNTEEVGTGQPGPNSMTKTESTSTIMITHRRKGEISALKKRALSARMSTHTIRKIVPPTKAKGDQTWRRNRSFTRHKHRGGESRGAFSQEPFPTKMAGDGEDPRDNQTHPRSGDGFRNLGGILRVSRCEPYKLSISG